MKNSADGTKSQNWPALVEQARRQVIETMETRLGITGLREKILWEEVNTPLTWKEKFNLAHGSILGITHDFFNVLSFRPQSRHPSIKNAYFVGASAHPGTGVCLFLPFVTPTNDTGSHSNCRISSMCRSCPFRPIHPTSRMLYYRGFIPCSKPNT